MSKKSKQISRLVKSRILSESHIPGCSIPDLAKAHGISAGTIYRWHREKQKLAMVKTRNKSETHSATPMVGNFVELSVCDHEEAEVSSSQSEESLSRNTDSISSHSALQKASFVFDDFSLTIEGRIKVSKIFEAIRVLEELC